MNLGEFRKNRLFNFNWILFWILFFQKNEELGSKCCGENLCKSLQKIVGKTLVMKCLWINCVSDSDLKARRARFIRFEYILEPYPYFLDA